VYDCGPQRSAMAKGHETIVLMMRDAGSSDGGLSQSHADLGKVMLEVKGGLLVFHLCAGSHEKDKTARQGKRYDEFKIRHWEGSTALMR